MSKKMSQKQIPSLWKTIGRLVVQIKIRALRSQTRFFTVHAATAWTLSFVISTTTMSINLGISARSAKGIGPLVEQ